MSSLRGRAGSASAPGTHTSTAATRRTRSRRRLRVLEGKKLPYFLILPALCFELLIHIVPLLAGVGISFLKLTQFYIRNWTQAPWAGLHNYDLALQLRSPIGKDILHSFEITVAFTVLVVGFAWALGMLGALIVNSEFRGHRWFRTLFLIPYAMPVYVAVIGWSFMLDRDNGALNTLLVDDLHLTHARPFWLLGSNAFWSIVMTTVWRLWPFAFLMTLAGMQSIPRELYEAAAVDGAGPLRQWRSITLPLLAPVTGVLILILFLWTFNEFNTPYVLFGPAPPHAADLLSLHIYVNSFVNLNFGLGSAMSVLLLTFLMIVSVVYIRIFRIGRETYA
ncbi:MAG TPA: sugar ABC transporter permease [Methylomirabilota bacterium]|nr:sugar ABC transporter permease [Methylomirabilota bacterium]